MTTPHTILETITTLQRHDGAFPGSSETLFGSVLTATILTELKSYESVQAILNRLVSYIEKQRHDDGSYGYWEKESPAQQQFPFPSDLDDTALAYAAIMATDQSRLDGTQLAKFITLLTSAEVTEGGPYNTWLTSWHDVDLGVNANIAYALHLLGVVLPNLDQLFESAIAHRRYESHYYHLPLLLLFYISRSYKGPAVPEAIEYILESQHRGAWGSRTETALALCTLSNFEYDITSCDDAVSFLRTAIASNDPLYKEFIHDGATTFYTNEAVSLSFIALALHRYEELQQSAVTIPEIPYALIQEQAVASCGLFADTAKQFSTALLAEPISRDTLALPYMIDSVSDELAQQIATAQLLGMMGYTTIDAVLDGERDKTYIPFALACIRLFAKSYEQLFPEQTWFDDVMLCTEKAFEQEYHTRLPQTDRGFSLTIPTEPAITWQKSYGYALPLFALYPEKQTSIASFFQSYLHAKQLHDDAHDLIDDLQQGRVTSVGAMVLERYKAQHPDIDSYSIPRDEQALRSIFWYECFPVTATMVTDAVATARMQLPQLPCNEYFGRMLSKIESAQKRASIEQKRMLEFLKTY